MSSSFSNTRSHRGFTLVELLVAITAGLFVAMGAFALAKQGSRFFQQEARIANAQFSAALGFERLRADIARAGFLSTANIQKDPFFCGTTAGWPAGMSSLAAVRIIPETPHDVQDSRNGLAPDQITLSGSYTSSELFPVRTVVPNGTKFEVYLQARNVGAIARSGGLDGGVLPQVFHAGRMLRIVDSTGRFEFGQIESYAINANGDPVILLQQNPALPFKRAGGTCGIEGLGVGMQANVVNWIRYEVRDLKKSPPAGYLPLYPDGGAAPGDETRLDLVRVEVGADNVEIDDSLELVAEYAVDLKFGVTVVSNFGATDPVLQTFDIGAAGGYEYTAAVSDSGPVSDRAPNRLRSIRARLVVRSREADRTSDIPHDGGNIFRYAIGEDAGFARARTITADIGLPNLASLTW